MARTAHRRSACEVCNEPEELISVAIGALLQDGCGVRTNPRSMKPGELCRALNSTPLGAVATTHRIALHRQRAGMRIGDGKTVDLVRYASWLFAERFVGRSAPTSAEEKLSREQERSIIRTEKSVRKESLEELLRAVPKGLYCQLAGRQQKVVDEHARRHQLPLLGPTVDMFRLIVAMHDILSEFGMVIHEQQGAQKALLEEKVAHLRTKRRKEELEIEQKQDKYMPRDEWAAILDWWLQLLRRASETFGRKYGPAAHQDFNDLLRKAAQEVDSPAKLKVRR